MGMSHCHRPCTAMLSLTARYQKQGLGLAAHQKCSLVLPSREISFPFCMDLRV